MKLTMLAIGPSKENADSAYESSMTLALTSVEVFFTKRMFRKSSFLTQNVIFFRKCWFSRFQKLHTVSQYSFGKKNFEQTGAFEYSFLQKTQTTFSLTHPSIRIISQQAEIKFVWNFLAKKFQKSSLQEILQRRVFIENRVVF